MRLAENPARINQIR